MLFSRAAALNPSAVVSRRAGSAVVPVTSVKAPRAARTACEALQSRRDVLFLSATIPAIATALALQVPPPAGAEGLSIPSINPPSIPSPQEVIENIQSFTQPAADAPQKALQELKQAAKSVAPRLPNDLQQAGGAIVDNVANSAASLVGALEPFGKDKTAQVQSAYNDFQNKTNEFKSIVSRTTGSKVEEALAARQKAWDSVFRALDGLVDSASNVLSQPSA